MCAVMQDTREDLLSDLLARWHAWSVHTPPAIGYYKENPSCRLYRASRQYDDHNGALDSDAENSIMQAVDAAIDRMLQPWKTAVEFNARNLVTGASVWRSPRLPADDIERAHVVMHARAKLMLSLEQDGVL